MARQSRVQTHPAQLWDAERSLQALEKQLESLMQLKGRYYHDADQAENEWEQLTEQIFEYAFDEMSTNHRNFVFAKNSGSYRIGGVSLTTMQSNYNKRIDAFETALKTAIAGLRLNLPQSEVRGHYDAGDPYAFYKDLKSLIRAASQTFLLVDAYLDTELFDLYVTDIPSTVDIRVLSSNLKQTVLSVGQIVAKSRPHFELRTAINLHDRMLFLDDRCWAMGQSVKDAAVKKPTYLVELNAPAQATLYKPIGMLRPPL